MSDWRAIVSSAQLSPPRNGDAIRCAGITSPALTDGIEQPTNLGHFEGCLLALCSNPNNERHIWGSAILVSPGIALTAAHVVRAFETSGHFEEKDYALVGLGPRTGGALDLWVTREITYVGNTDVAILVLELRSAIPPCINVAKMTTRSPSVPDRLICAGFVASREVFSHTSEDDDDTLGIALVCSCGPILDLYETGRDATLRGPSLAAEFATINGMSGGPVFNSVGNLVGILSSGIPASDERADTSFVSLIRRALASPINPPWPTHWYQRNTRLVDGPNGCFLDDAERLTVIVGADGAETLSHRHSP
ncbi:MAG: S1 family peptidase [Rhizomicrobium sp.]